jgi:MFS family permease
MRKTGSRESNLKTSSRDVLKWNFSMGLIHGIFFTGGQAFSNPDTIIPVFLNHFTDSKTLIGLSSTLLGSLGGIGSVLPQLFVARRLENKSRKKPLLAFAITVRALSWGFLAVTTYFFANRSAYLTISFLFFFLIVFTFMGGIAAVSFYDIWGKSLPSQLRGRFFGHRELWGGVLAIGSGFIAKLVLGSGKIMFPLTFVLLFFLTFAFMSISYIALGLVKEPVEQVYERRLSFNEFLKKAFRIIKEDKDYRRFVLVQILAGGAALALPFYILYARQLRGIELETVGVLLSAQMLGRVLSNILWAHLSDFVGNKRVIQISTLAGLLVPFIALLTRSQNRAAFIVMFVLIGFFVSGRLIGKTNYLLDTASSKDRPTYISLTATLTFPISLFSLAGGLVVQFLSYQVVFAVTLAVMAAGFILSFGLREPRLIKLREEKNENLSG